MVNIEIKLDEETKERIDTAYKEMNAHVNLKMEIKLRYRLNLAIFFCLSTSYPQISTGVEKSVDSVES